MKHQSDFLMKGEFDGDETQFGLLPQEPGRSKQYTQHRYSIDSLTYLVKTVSLIAPLAVSFPFPFLPYIIFVRRLITELRWAYRLVPQ